MHAVQFKDRGGILNCGGDCGIVIASSNTDPFRLLAVPIQSEDESKLESKLFAHEAVKDEINGSINERQGIPHFSPFIVTIVKEVFTVDTSQ